MDRYQALRDMPFTVIAQALGIDMARFKTRKGGAEMSGRCPVPGARAEEEQHLVLVQQRRQVFESPRRSVEAAGEAGRKISAAAGAIAFWAACTQEGRWLSLWDSNSLA